MADPSGRPQSSGVARRRRQRRLRSMLRHERMTVAMALAEFSHHSSRGQRMARAGVWGHEQNYTAKVRKPPTPQPELFSLEEEPGDCLPAPLSEVAGRQEKVVRHVLEDLGSVCPFVQILDLPVPHRMDHLAELLNLEEDVLDAGRLVDRFFQVPELVIEVPKISLDVIPLRALVPEPQLAEQLVEVPTIVSFSSLQRIMEQTVDIPVPRGDRTLLPASSSSVLPVTANEGVFRTFPQNKKKCGVGLALGVETSPRVEPIHAGCSAEGGDGGLVRCPGPAQDAGATGPAS